MAATPQSDHGEGIRGVACNAVAFLLRRRQGACGHGRPNLSCIALPRRS